MNVQKFQQKQNEIFFKQMINMLNEGGTYIWPDLGVGFIMNAGKLIAPNTAALKAARSIVSKKAGLRLFTM